MWRREPVISGPEQPTPADIDQLNRIFSTAFSDRYRRDGMPGVRVPHLNPDIWRFALETAGRGAMVWRDRTGEIVAFNLAHRSGVEGWMGPLAVRPDRQGAGLGRQVVLAGIAWLRENGATTIGLETMPRTVENIGFYSQLGFLPGHLTVSLTRSPDTGSATVCTRISRDPAGATALTACEDLLDAVMPGVSFRREFRLTADLALGDATLYRREGALAAFALWHAAPLAQGRPREDLRVLKLVAADVDAMLKVLSGVGAAAEEEGTERVTVRCQTRQATAYAALIAGGWQAHWTDLRMSLTGREERAPVGVCFSNWEI